MYAKILADLRFHQFLLDCDRDLAAEQHARACVYCGDKLDVANYTRKPRGRPLQLGGEHDQRFSFCCRRDGCRSRATPPSLRFLGRRVYLAAVVVLIAILQSGESASRLARLSEAITVPPRTIARWRRWWRGAFTTTPFWQSACARFMPPIMADALPGALLARFAGDDRERLVAMLRFIGPLTGSAMRR